MKTLYNFVLEAENEENAEMTDTENDEMTDTENDEASADEEKDEKIKRRANIKFTIWEEPKKKVTWVNKNTKYQKIEYKYQDKEKQVFIHFLLGFKDDSWQLWVGKIGAVGYDDDPEYDLKTKDFKEAIITALDKIEDFLDDVYENPDNWVQFYKNK